MTTTFKQYLEARDCSALTIKSYLSYLPKIRATNFTQEGVEHYFAIYKHFPQRAALKAYFEFKQVQGIKYPKRKGRQAKKQPKFLNKPEIERLLEIADRKMKLMILLSFEGGLRADELCSLTKDNIDFATNEVRGVGKGKKDYIVKFTPRTSRLLQQYIEHEHIGETLFNMNRKTWHKHLTRFTQKILGKKVNPHQLRHSLGTHLSRKNVNAFKIQDYMRHADISSTEKYIHIQSEEAREEIAEVL